MSLNREIIEARFDYAWIQESIYADVHLASWDVGEVDAPEAASTTILPARSLCAITSAWDDTSRQLDFSCTVSIQNVTDSILVFNRITLWRGTNAVQANLGSAELTGTNVVLDANADSAPVTGGRVFLVVENNVYEAQISGTPSVSSFDIASIPAGLVDGTISKVVVADGLFVGASLFGFDTSVALNDSVQITITGANINA